MDTAMAMSWRWGSGSPRLTKAMRNGLAAIVAVLIAISFAPRPGAAATLGTTKADPALVSAAHAAPASTLHVIVREATPSSTLAEGLVRRLGGRITHELPIIGSFSASLPAKSLDALTRSSSILKIWGDAHVKMMGGYLDKYATWAPNTLWRAAIGLDKLPASSNGNGVTVAVLDTGITANADFGSRVVYHASFAPDTDLFDHFGHGTHMAGIIGGDGTLSSGQYKGVAPRANLVSIKVAEPDGSTDVSVVIDGLQWAYYNRAAYNIRVLNLSFGTDSTQGYLLDPLDYAVEQVWNAGIVVVVAAGNHGPIGGTITKPGDDPYVITVGAADVTDLLHPLVADFSSRGPTQDGLNKPDFVAPGISIVSARDPGSYADTNFPTARVGEYYFKGTGTSQATAMTSGVAALMIQANPSLSPNMVKAIMVGTARKGAFAVGAGAGLLSAQNAVTASSSTSSSITPANQGLTASTGLGSLESSRGSAAYHVYADLNGDGVPEMVTGDNIGWDGSSWGGSSWGGSSWGGSSWGGSSWGGSSWGGSSWGGSSWGGSSWGGSSWGGSAWGGSAWGGSSWGGSAWGDSNWG